LKTLKFCRKSLIDRDFDVGRIVIESAVACLGVTPPKSRYQVIQWGTGAVGAEMITAILDHRNDLELVGAKVYSEAKHGEDVGTFVGRDPVGVLATADTAETLAMQADCVLYTPRTADLDEVCAILSSGKNVATTAFLFHPRRLPAADRDRVHAACEQGGSSVHGSGLNPGNLSGVLPLALSGMSRSIDKMTLQERADWSMYESTGITFDNMAFGQPVEQISPTTNDFLAFNSSIFTEQVWLLADALNAGIDEVTATVEAVAAGGPPDLRPCAAGGDDGGAAVELGGAPRRRTADRDRDAVDRRRRIPRPLAAPEGRLDVDDRGRSIHAHALLLAGELHPPCQHLRTRALGERGDRDAGAQRGTCGVRRRARFRHHGDIAPDPQPHRIRQRLSDSIRTVVVGRLWRCVRRGGVVFG